MKKIIFMCLFMVGCSECSSDYQDHPPPAVDGGAPKDQPKTDDFWIYLLLMG